MRELRIEKLVLNSMCIHDFATVQAAREPSLYCSRYDSSIIRRDADSFGSDQSPSARVEISSPVQPKCWNNYLDKHLYTARPATPSGHSVSDVTRRSPCMLQSEARRQKRSSREA